MAIMMRKTLGVLALALGALTGCSDSEPLEISGDVVKLEDSGLRDWFPAKQKHLITELGYKTLEAHGVPRDFVVNLKYNWPEGVESHFEYIKELHDKGIDPIVIQTYKRSSWEDSDFTLPEKVALWEAEISATEALEYPDYFRASHIFLCRSKNVSGKVADALANRHSDLHVIDFVKEGIPDDIEDWDYAHPKAIEKAKMLGLDLKTFHEYDSSLNEHERVLLFEQEPPVLPPEASRFLALNNEYDLKITAADIVRFRERKLSYDQIRQESKRISLHRLLTE